MCYTFIIQDICPGKDCGRIVNRREIDVICESAFWIASLASSTEDWIETQPRFGRCAFGVEPERVRNEVMEELCEGCVEEMEEDEEVSESCSDISSVEERLEEAEEQGEAEMDEQRMADEEMTDKEEESESGSDRDLGMNEVQQEEDEAEDNIAEEESAGADMRSLERADLRWLDIADEAVKRN